MTATRVRRDDDSLASGRQRLRFRVWMGTLGRWGPVQSALARFERADQRALGRQITHLMNRLSHGLAGTRPRLLDQILPAVARACSPSQLSAGLGVATSLANRGVDPSEFLRAIVSAVTALTPEQLDRSLALASALAEPGRDPTPLLREIVPEIAPVMAPDQLRLAFDVATRLARQGIDPSETLRYGIPAIARLSPTPQAFQANLRAWDGVVTRVRTSAAKSASCHRDLNLGLREASRGLAPDQFSAGLDLALVMTEQGLEPSFALRRLRNAAAGLTREQFAAGLALTLRLVRRGIDGSLFMVSAVPAMARISPTDSRFEEGLRETEALIARLSGRARPQECLVGLDDVVRASATPEGMMANFAALEELVAVMAEREISPSHTLRNGLDRASRALAPEPFSMGLRLAIRLARRAIDPAALLEYGLPAAARGDHPPSAWAANIQALERFLGRLADRGMPSHGVPYHDLDTIAQASPTPEAFEANLQRLEALVVRLDEHRTRPSYPSATPSSSLAAAVKSLTPEQFTIALEFATDLAERGFDPAYPLRCVPHIARVSPTLEGFRANVSALDKLVTLQAYGGGRSSSMSLDDSLNALSRDLEPPRFAAALTAAVRMAERGPLDHATLVMHIPAAAKTFNEHEFAICLGVGRQLVEQGIAPSTAPGLVELTRHAVSLIERYEGVQPVGHPALMSSALDQYGYSYEVIDHPAWVELRPRGRLLRPSRLDPIDPERTEALLAARSWLWRAWGDVGRETALQRVAYVRAYFAAIVDGLIGHRVLDADVGLVSAYLIGSYPWRSEPADVDLFIVTEGICDVQIFSSQALAARGVQVAEFPLPWSTEIVGHESLLLAGSGHRISNAERLALRYTRLYGSVLLAGRDLFETAHPSVRALEALRKALLEDAARAAWPECAGDSWKMNAKRWWRRREAEALEVFARGVKNGRSSRAARRHAA